MEFFTWFSIIFISVLNAEVIRLNNLNIKSILDENELVLVDFYANWCHYSNLLDPIFIETSNKLEKEFKDKGKVILAKVDCEEEIDIAKEYAIQKYPTIKLFRFGNICKREYRGARNSDAMVEYIKEEMRDPIKDIGENGSLVQELGNSYIIGQFQSKLSQNFDLFKKIGFELRYECNLFFQITPDIAREKLTYESISALPVVWTEFTNKDRTKRWIRQKCIQFVRNITFQNAEDITEEGRPLVLLFYKAGDEIITTIYTKLVAVFLDKERELVNFVYVNGALFAHPLQHLGKSEADLPLFAIDSFKHIYLLSAKVEDALKDPRILKKFIADMHSGKLHREFHSGNEQVVTDEQPQGDSNSKLIPSVFKKLRPNSNRYTLFHDEF